MIHIKKIKIYLDGRWQGERIEEFQNFFNNSSNAIKKISEKIDTSIVTSIDQIEFEGTCISMWVTYETRKWVTWNEFIESIGHQILMETI